MTWLICDYGEVLSLAQPASDRAAIEAAAGVSAGEAQPLWERYWHHRPGYDRADVTAEVYWRAVLGEPPDRDRLELLRSADVASWLHPNPESVAAVEELHRRKVRLALFSNAPVDVAAGIAAAPWLAAFSVKFFSCDLRAVKPEPAAYKAVLEALGARPDEVVFVDDRPANVAGAKAVGIEAVLFESAAQLASLV